MTPFSKPLCFVDNPGNLDRQTLTKAKNVGFGAIAIRGQSGVWTDEPDEERKGSDARRLNPAEIVKLRDDARGIGLAACLWVVLDLGNDWPGWDLTEAAKVTNGYVQHFDGLVVNAEAILPHAWDYFDDLTYTGPLMLSTLPTFAGSRLIRDLDKRGAWLAQQGYSLENEHTPLSCRHWALGGTAPNGITYPPLNVGWHYRATILNVFRRVEITGQDWLGYILQEGRNRWGLDPDTRRIFNRQNRKVVGKLQALWGPGRFTPTIRTTPVGYDFLSAEEIRAQRAQVPGVAVGAYLGESTKDEQWAGWT